MIYRRPDMINLRMKERLVLRLTRIEAIQRMSKTNEIVGIFKDIRNKVRVPLGRYLVTAQS